MTGWMPDVVPDAPIESAWGNKIGNRTIVPFTTVAERDSYITAPVVGMECYVTATDSLYYYNGSAWKGRARGRIGYAVPSVMIQAPSASVFVDALSIALTAPETRLVRVTSFMTVFGAAASNVYARLVTLAAVLGPNFVSASVPAGGTSSGMISYWGTIGTASTTFKSQFASSVAASGRVYPNDTANLSWLSVEDMGTP